MAGLSNFVVQNYFWILMIGIVLIMALIGYIADKKNLVKLERKPRKSNEKEDAEILEKVQEKHLADAIYGNESEENMVSPEAGQSVEAENNEEIPSDLFAPMGDITASVESASAETVNGMEIVNFGELEAQNIAEVQSADEVNNLSNEIVDFNVNELPTVDENNSEAEIENITSPDIEQVISETNDVPAELYAPLESTDAVSEPENNTVPVNEENEDSPIEAELPDLNNISEESEEDVWKF